MVVSGIKKKRAVESFFPKLEIFLSEEVNYREFTKQRVFFLFYFFGKGTNREGLREEGLSLAFLPGYFGVFILRPN